MPNVYELVTDRIIAQFELGNIPWKKPWTVSPPQNLNGHKYRGINVWLLAGLFDDPRFATFKQVQDLGGRVHKGAKGNIVVFWTTLKKEVESKAGDIEEKNIPFLRYYTVFNVSQCDIPGLIPLTQYDVAANISADDLVNNMPQRPSIKYDGGDAAYYSPVLDSIHLPKRSSFPDQGGYYGTLFHELVHSTGHDSRLSRDLNQIAAFGSELYSKEELIAELGAAYLCDIAGVTQTIENNAAYIKSWLTALKDDKRLVITAATKAQAAADFIQGIASQKV